MDQFIIIFSGGSLAGVALVVPAVNYWWRSLPANLSKHVFGKLFVEDQITFWIAHNAPFLFYGWINQKWFKTSAIVAGSPKIFTKQDMEVIKKRQAYHESIGVRFSVTDNISHKPASLGSLLSLCYHLLFNLNR